MSEIMGRLKLNVFETEIEGILFAAIVLSSLLLLTQSCVAFRSLNQGEEEADKDNCSDRMGTLAFMLISIFALILCAGGVASKLLDWRTLAKK